MIRTPLSAPLFARPLPACPGNRLSPVLVGGLLALSLGLASCGKADHGSEATPTGSFSDFAWGGGNPAGDAPLPDAEPMLDTAPSAPPAAPSRASRYLASSGPAPVSYLPQYRDKPADAGSYVSNPDAGDYDMLALASTLGAVFGSAPPDYGFDYGDQRPWAWETGDRYVRYAEPIDQGYRYYYYGPDSDQPYLVRDPWYSYGYRDGRLAQIYGRDGRVLDARRALVQRRMADRYYARALAMRRAAESERHQGVSAQNWARHRVAVARAQDDWDRDSARRPGWERWDQRHAPVITARWTRERAVRRFAGDRFARWQQAGFRGKSPDFYQEAADNPALRRDIHQQRQQAIRQAQAGQMRAAQAQAGQSDRRVDRQRDQTRRARQQAMAAARQQQQQRQHVAQQRREAQARQASARRDQAGRAQQRREAQVRQASARREQAGRAQQRREAQARQASSRREQAGRAQQRREAQARQASSRREQAGRARQRREAQVRQASARREQAGRAQQRREAQVRQASSRREQAGRVQQRRETQAHRAQARAHNGGHGASHAGRDGERPGHH